MKAFRLNEHENYPKVFKHIHPFELYIVTVPDIGTLNCKELQFRI